MLKNIIIQMESLQKKKQQILEEERKLLRPTLTDVALIGNIYDMFLTAMHELHPKVRELNNTIQRSKFIFIILYLYSPETFCGRKMKRGGIREKIAKVTGCKKTLISHNCRNVKMYYYVYSDFHADVDAVYEKILRRLEEAGKIRP